MFTLVAAVVVTCSLSAEAQCSRTVTCSTVISDSLSDNSCLINGFPTKTYLFSGTAGQKLTVSVSNSSGASMFIELQDPAGNTVTTSFLDEPTSLSATLPTTGQYKILVNFGNPHTSASYSLTVQCTASSNPTTCTYTSTIKMGDTVDGQLTSSDTACGTSRSYMKAYRLQVLAGDAFEVTYSPSFAPYIEIDGPDSSGAFRSAANGPVTISYVAPSAGNVSIFVGSNTTTPVTGSFQLRVTSIQLPPCGRVRAVRH